MTQSDQELIAIVNNAHAALDQRLSARALVNLRLCEKSSHSYEEYYSLDKRDLLYMILESSKLMHEAAEKIATQRSQITKFQMDVIANLT